MSKMGNIIQDIEDRIVNSDDSYDTIAQKWGVTVEWVVDVARRLDNVEEYSPYSTCDS